MKITHVVFGFGLSHSVYKPRSHERLGFVKVLITREALPARQQVPGNKQFVADTRILPKTILALPIFDYLLVLFPLLAGECVRINLALIWGVFLQVTNQYVDNNPQPYVPNVSSSETMGDFGGPCHDDYLSETYECDHSDSVS